MSKLVIVFLSLLLLTGCKQNKIKVVPIETKPKLSVADAPPVKLGKVEWIVITEANFASVVAKLKASKSSIVIMGVTTDGYKNIRMNEAQLLKLIKQQKSVTMAYRKYYE